MTARVHARGGVARVKPLVRSLPFVALLGPALLVLAALALYPVAQVLVDSFCRVDYAAGRRAFAGLANYRAVLGDDAFSAGFGNTLRFTIVASLAEVALGFGLALLFVRAFPGRRIALPLAILPMMLSTLVCSAIWRNWLNFDGFLMRCSPRSASKACAGCPIRISRCGRSRWSTCGSGRRWRS